jgi:hypothetical protein
MVFLETALDSKLNPLIALGRSGTVGFSSLVNKFNADAELLDDLVCHSHNAIVNVVDSLGRMTTGPQSVTRFENNVMCGSNLTRICLPERT